MKKYLVSCLMLGAFLLMGTVESAYAWFGWPPPNHHVPEPTMLALLGSGIAGIGIYSFIRRKNRK